MREGLRDIIRSTVRPLVPMRRATKAWLRRWRRSRLAKRRALSRQTILLVGSFILLAVFFAWSLSYLSPKHQGSRISISQFNALAEQKRIEIAAFRHQDAQIVGRYSCQAHSASASGH